MPKRLKKKGKESPVLKIRMPDADMRDLERLTEIERAKRGGILGESTMARELLLPQVRARLAEAEADKAAA